MSPAVALHVFTVQLNAAGTAVEAEFKQLYSDITQAVRSMDHAKSMSFLSRNFSMTTPDGKVHDRAETEHDMKVNADTTHKVKACSNTGDDRLSQNVVTFVRLVTYFGQRTHRGGVHPVGIDPAYSAAETGCARAFGLQLLIEDNSAIAKSSLTFDGRIGWSFRNVHLAVDVLNIFHHQSANCSR